MDENKRVPREEEEDEEEEALLNVKGKDTFLTNNNDINNNTNKKEGEKRPLAIYTREEIATHDNSSDCWLIIHGKVYDVTKYMHKHPPGMAFLLKNAGRDATQDFEGMFHSSRARSILATLEVGTVKGQAVSSRALSAHKHRVPAFALSYGLNTNSITEEAEEITKKTEKLTLSKPTTSNIKTTTVSGSGSASGSSRSKAISKKSVTMLELTEISLLNHNTKIFRFKVDSQLNIPAGYHVTLMQPQPNGKIRKRNYTPILDKPNYFEIMVKRYNTGKMSEYIHNMKLKEKIGVTGPFGKWKYSVQDGELYSRILMIAAGTGIAPMYQVLNAMVYQANCGKAHPSAVVLYANKTRRDILLKKKFDSWSSDEFVFHYILSEPEPEEKEYMIGHISSDIISSVLKPQRTNSREFVLICGPTGFNEKAEKIFKEDLLYPEEQIHVF